MTLAELNNLPIKSFLNTCEPLLEYCDWALPELANSRPFSSKEEIQKKLKLIISLASEQQKSQALIHHPKLALGHVQAGFSQQEQTEAGLTRLTQQEFERFATLNAQYEQKMGFPFIVAVTGLSKKQILEQMTARCLSNKTIERLTALEELIKIAQIRVHKLIDQD